MIRLSGRSSSSVSAPLHSVDRKRCESLPATVALWLPNQAPFFFLAATVACGGSPGQAKVHERVWI